VATMRAVFRRFARDERGATLALTAVMLVSLLSVVALAMDLGLLYTARAEAQRAADSAALAGAAEFIYNVPATAAINPATAAAEQYATMNQIRNVAIDTSEVTVQVDAPSRSVHVMIRRAGIPMWFARLFGWSTAPVAASAMARASATGTQHCMAPLALPDWWDDPDDDDVVVNQMPDPAETWTWGDDPGQESYQPYTNDSPGETGLGSLFRGPTRDRGRLMVVKQQTPGGNPNNPNPIELQPGWFHAVRLPNNADGSTNKGANDFRNSFYNCTGGPVAVGDTLDLEQGNMVGPTNKAVDSLIALDPGAQWDNTTQMVTTGWGSPRILTIMLFSPEQLAQMQGNHEFQPNNFALFFIEGRTGGGGSQASITGRFIQYASGTGGPGPAGSLNLRVQLVQ